MPDEIRLKTDDEIFNELARDTLAAKARGFKIDMDTTGLDVQDYYTHWGTKYDGCPRCCIGAHLAHATILRDPLLSFPSVTVHLAIEYGRSLAWARGLVVGTMPRNLELHPSDSEFKTGLTLGRRLLEWVQDGMPEDVLS